MSFEYQGATISAHELTIADDDLIALLQSKLPLGAIVNSGTPFMEFMVGADIKGEAPVPMITRESSDAEVAASYAAWKALPRSFLKLWRQEVENTENLAPKG